MFKWIKNKSAASAPSTSLRLSPDISASILASVGAKSIPPMPGAAQKAFALSTDPNADAKDFIEVIESDEGLSARVIKIANSVYFDRGKASKTVEQSVVVIGLEELRCLLNATTLSEIFSSKHPARSQLWANDIATGIIARTLAERVGGVPKEIAFLAGLMHDIGKLLLLQRTPDLFVKAMKLMEQSGTASCQAEEQVFVFNHTEVGLLVGQRWNFSPDLLGAIRHHHDAWGSAALTGMPLPLPAFVKAADTIAHALGLGHGKNMSTFKNANKEAVGVTLEALGIPQSEEKSLLARCEREYNQEYDLFVK